MSTWMSNTALPFQSNLCGVNVTQKRRKKGWQNHHQTSKKNKNKKRTETLVMGNGGGALPHRGTICLTHLSLTKILQTQIIWKKKPFQETSVFFRWMTNGNVISEALVHESVSLWYECMSLKWEPPSSNTIAFFHRKACSGWPTDSGRKSDSQTSLSWHLRQCFERKVFKATAGRDNLSCFFWHGCWHTLGASHLAEQGRSSVSAILASSIRFNDPCSFAECGSQNCSWTPVCPGWPWNGNAVSVQRWDLRFCSVVLKIELKWPVSCFQTDLCYNVTK